MRKVTFEELYQICPELGQHHDEIEVDLSTNPLSRPPSDPLRDLFEIIINIDYLPFTFQYIFGITTYPTQHAFIKSIDESAFPLIACSRGFSKSSSLAMYIMYKLLTCPGIRIVVAGAAMRQSKAVFEYCKRIWNNAPVLRSMCTGDDQGCVGGNDRCRVMIGESECLFIPLGDGETIRGLRANILICDEFASVNKDVFETVLKGFTAVSSNPVENLKNIARLNMLKRKGLVEKDTEAKKSGYTNKTIVSGTCSYAFNHFSEYFKNYKTIIKSKGNPEYLKREGAKPLAKGLSHKDFTIIRIPYQLVPEGFMDAQSVGSAQATSDEATFMREFGAVFVKDSDGFFKRSLIESCTPTSPITINKTTIHPFTASLIGEPSVKYFMGIDPAIINDNFSIVIVGCYPEYRKVCYCWTINKGRLAEKIKKAAVEQQDYLNYCAKKVRALLRVFPCEIISIDTQGGGYALAETLRDADKIPLGEKPLYPVRQDHPFAAKLEYGTDDLPGHHIIELVAFGNAVYLSEANTGLRKDLEDKVLLFPFFDGVAAVRAGYEDESENRINDTLEDCMWEIEELKDELSSIRHTQTGVTMRDHWDTPEVKDVNTNTKGRVRKDRYSALLIANMAARRIERQIVPNRSITHGGFVGRVAKSEGSLFSGPDWFTSKANS